MGKRGPKPGDRAEQYETQRRGAADRSRARSKAGRDIGDLPPVEDPIRREAGRTSFRHFAETYLADRFPLAWSQDHLAVISRLETCVLDGGQFAFAMPRGSGKTTLCEAAALWSLVYGHRKFVVLIGATEPHASELLDSIKITFETNQLLLEDFPKIVYPIVALGRNALRARMQTYGGKETRIGWTGDEVILPTMEGSPASGSLLRVAGITGRIRGLTATLADGRKIRPDLAIVDDPQTDESSRSLTQNATREKVLSGAILGLAGPGQKIAAFMPCTVITPGDLADRILDRDRHPEWQGVRCKLLYQMPARMDLWDEYGRLRAEGLRNGTGTEAANRFYAAKRGLMDAGSAPAWEQRFNSDEISALQHAMNLYYSNPSGFASEYQNAPLVEQQNDGVTELDPDMIAAKLNLCPRGAVPDGATRLTAGIDVQGKVLFWIVVAWNEKFGGSIVDYGAWPAQNRAYFAASDARPSLADVYPHMAYSAAVYAALGALTGELFGRVWKAEGTGRVYAIDKLVIDANYPQSTDSVYDFVRQSPYRALMVPSHGRGIGAGNTPIDQWSRKDGEIVGPSWRIGAGHGNRTRRLIYDTNFWKSFVAERLQTPAGSPGSLYLPGSRAADHQLLADHLTAEQCVTTYGRGRSVQEWRVRPDRRENHWGDCLVLCAVGASVTGLRWSAANAAKPDGESEASGRANRTFRFSERVKNRNRG